MRAYFRAVLTVTVGLLVSATGAAVVPAHAAAGFGAILGTVTAAGGQGLEGIEVTAYRWNGTYGGWYRAMSATTFEGGWYGFSQLEPGTYRVGFADSSRTYANEFYDNEKFVDVARDVLVVDGEQTPDINAELDRTGSITGTVTKGPGAAAPGIYVAAYQWQNQGGGYWGQVAYATTGPAGSYDLVGLDTGDYRLKFSDVQYGGLAAEFWDDVATVNEATNIRVTRGQVSSGRDARLAAASHITGRVVDRSGQPVEGLVVSALQKDPTYGFWSSIASARTNSSGNYDIGTLSRGTYRLGYRTEFGTSATYLEEYWPYAAKPESASDIQVGPAATIDGKNLTVEKPATITGTVTSASGAPLAGASVSAKVWNPMTSVWDYVSGLPTPYTNAAGKYTMNGLRGGRYRLSFSATGPNNSYMWEWWDNEKMEDDATPIDLAPQATRADVDVVMERGSTVTGSVRTTGSLGDRELSLLPYRWNAYWSQWQSAEWPGWVGPDGAYELSNLQSGTYRLALRLDSTTVGWWGGGTSLESASSIVVGPDATVSGKDLQVDLGGAVPDPEPTPSPTTTPTITPTTTPTTQVPDIASQLAAAVTGVEVTGKPSVGKRVKVGGIEGLPSGAKVVYQWFAGSQKIKKATRSSLRVTAPLRGKKLTVRVTITAEGIQKVVVLKAGKVR